MKNEKGMALVAVLLLLMTISALGAALAISGTTETLIARNHQNAAEARAAAEAGLSHAAALTVDFLNTWPGTYLTAALAINALLADSSLAGIDDLEAGIATLDGLADVDYEATVVDDDDEAGRDIDLDTTDALRMGEDGNADTDINLKVVIRAKGYAGGSAVATVEATIAPIELPALITDGNLEIGGDVDVSSTPDGAIHANGNLDFDGSAWSADTNGDGTTDSGACTASGTSDGGTGCPGGAGTITLPEFQASDYRDIADFILHADGSMTTVATGTRTTCNPCNNWELSGSEWSVPSGSLATSTPVAGTYYVEGADIEIDRNITQTLTIIAEGDIQVGQAAVITPNPDAGGLLFVTDQDLEISAAAEITTQGQILVVEQIRINGGPTIRGQIIVRNADDLSDFVEENEITGGADIIYDGGFDDTFFALLAWRRAS